MKMIGNVSDWLSYAGGALIKVADSAGSTVYLFFLFLPQNIDCGYLLEPPRRVPQNIDCGDLLEPPRRGGSNVYPQSMF